MGYPLSHNINPPTRKYILINVHILILSISLLFVLCRIFIRLKLRKTGVDDALIVISWVLVLAASLCVCISTHYGLGQHVWDISPELFPTGGKLTYAFITLYDPTAMFTKCSILTFYLRLAPPTHTALRVTCYVTIVYTVLSGTSFLLVNLFGCTPIEGAWHWGRGFQAHCVDKYALYMISGANNALTDVFLLLLPVPVLMELTMSLQKKLGMMAIFLTGFLAVIMAIIRLHAIHVGGGRNGDFAWNGAYTAMWSSIELATGITTACMPSVKMLVVWLFPGIGGEDSSNVAGPGGIEIVTIGGGEAGRRNRVYAESNSLAGDGGSEECIVRIDLEEVTKVEEIVGSV